MSIMLYYISYDEVLSYGINGRLTSKIVLNGFKKLFILPKILRRISKASKIPYPPIIIIPEARLLILEEGLTAVVYANLSIRRISNRITPAVEMAMPFLLYSDNSSKVAVLGHELLHYLYLAFKFYSNEYYIHPLIYTSNISGRMFLEDLYQFKPDIIFDKGRVLYAVKKFDEILRKDRISYKIKKNWIDRGLPTKAVYSSEFKLSISIEDFSNLYFPDSVLMRVRDMVGEYG